MKPDTLDFLDARPRQRSPPDAEPFPHLKRDDSHDTSAAPIDLTVRREPPPLFDDFPDPSRPPSTTSSHPANPVEDDLALGSSATTPPPEMRKQFGSRRLSRDRTVYPTKESVLYRLMESRKTVVHTPAMPIYGAGVILDGVFNWKYYAIPSRTRATARTTRSSPRSATRRGCRRPPTR